MPTRSSDVAGPHDPQSDGTVLNTKPKKEQKPREKNPALKAAAAKVADQFYVPKPIDDLAAQVATAEDAKVPGIDADNTPIAEAAKLVVDAGEPTKELTFEELLAEDRKSIDEKNEMILLAVQNRIAFAKSILRAKHKTGVNLRDKAREQKMLQKLFETNRAFGQQTGVTLLEHEVRYIFEELIQFGLDHFRQDIANKRNLKKDA